MNSKLFGSKEEILEIFSKMNLDLQIRGEKLTIEQFAELANLKNCQKGHFFLSILFYTLGHCSVFILYF